MEVRHDADCMATDHDLSAITFSPGTETFPPQNAGIISLRPRLPSARTARSQCVKTQAFFNFGKAKTAAPAPKRVVRETIIPEPSYNVPIGFLTLAGLSGYAGNAAAAGLLGVLGVFLGIQVRSYRT